MSFLKREPYPSFPEEWDDPINTVYREFYLTCSADFALLRALVKDHIPDKGNDSITRHRLMCILQDCENRAFYLRSRQRTYPYTWRLRWWWLRTKKFLHRRLKTAKFHQQVEACRIAVEVCRKMNSQENK